MTISVRFIALSILLSITLFSCFRPDDFDEVPRIAFEKLEFREVAGNIPDSLILTIDFQDGDGNLGLLESFDLPPVHSFDFIVDANNRFVTLSGEGFEPPFDRVFPGPDPNGSPQLLLFDRDPNADYSDFDNRPPKFDCQFYVVDSIEAFWGVPFPPYDLSRSENRLGLIGFDCSSNAPPCVVRDTLLDQNGSTFFQTKLDTFYIAKNEQNRNIFVDFFRKRSGEYEFIDWTRAFSENGCGPDFNARFPVFDEKILQNENPIEGTIRYSMQSEGFRLLLRNDTFKIQVRILDGSFNSSNTVESPDLTLQQIGG